MLDQPVSTPLTKNPKINQTKVFTALGLILVFSVLILGSLWVYLNSKGVGKTTDDTDTKTSSSSAKALEIEDWKTYINSTYNYSFEYPKDWVLDGSYTSEVRVSTNEDHFAPGMTVSIDIGATDFAYSVHNEAYDKTTFLGYKAIKYTWPYQTDVQVFRNKILYILSFGKSDPNDPDTAPYSSLNNEADEVFSHILSTFKFL